MSAKDGIALGQHRLEHLPDLTVRSDVLEARFPSGCSTSNCDAACCANGVLVDLRERDAILQSARLVQRYMDPEQDKNPANWFQPEEQTDSDFPSGKAVGTQVRGSACVFLDSAGRCVLQKARESVGNPSQGLKPFFCTAYPITIVDGVLCIDEPVIAARTQCCTPRPGSELSVLDVCSMELEHVLGQAGLNELRAVNERHQA